ncbi:MAG: type I-C CRISPR-associated endonuclease Cas1 [Lentisphaeria bacterium]|nr:type I-C CRISPR-associated endonuclease Cas1 [Lentisphaeria bacterium]
MKKLLNTLYVSTQGIYLSKEGETVLASLKGEKRLQLPLLNLSGIICFGNVMCSPFLLGACAERGIAISFLTESGSFLARVQGKVSGNILLRREQYRIADSEARSERIARNIVAAKLVNSRNILQRFQRDHGEVPEIGEAVGYLKHQIDFLKRGSGTCGLAALRGMEGEAAVRYFALFNRLITAQKAEFHFAGRSRRPPLDPVNALLSFVYALLSHDMVGALESVGLDPAAGFLHCDRPGRASLALDLVEEFRQYIADRLVLNLINLKQVTGRGFRRLETGAVQMDETTRKTVIAAYQERKQEEIVHPFLKEKIKIGLLPYVQALLLARYVRGDLPEYPPFVGR